MKQNTSAFVGKHVLPAALAAALLQLGLPAVSNAQPLQPASGLRVVPSEATPRAREVFFAEAGSAVVNARETMAAAPLQSSVATVEPSAMTTAVVGKCEYSADGVAFTPLEKGRVLEQGVTLRAGEGARADLFFRRTGITVRLQAGTEIKLEKMTVATKNGLPVEDTLLDLRKGRIFTVVRSTVAGSTFEIRNAAGRSVVEGSGIGRYIITADGTHVAATGSVIPLKVIGENGITVISAGQQFDKSDGKVLPASTSVWVKDMIELDELQAATENRSSEATVVNP
jgi:hypothetical protein